VRRTYISPGLGGKYNYQWSLLLPASCKVAYFDIWYITNDREILPSNFVASAIYQPRDEIWAEPGTW